MDFGALSPEINSGRMYAGLGSGPMLAAAAAWDGLASELSTAAADYSMVLSGLASSWTGPSAMLMAAAVAPYVAWMNVTAIHAQQAGAQAYAAAAAYEAAFEMHVPPPLIAANRALLMSLIATNIIGQNTPAIAATEAHYAEMWVQDAGAMYGYAGASKAASTLMPFPPPPTTTNPLGLIGQGAAVSHATASPAGVEPTSMLAQLASAASPTSSETSPASSSLRALELGRMATSTPNSVRRYATAAGTALRYAEVYSAANKLFPGLGPFGMGGFVGGDTPVSATMGNAGSIGALSVPPGWSAAAPSGLTGPAVTGLPDTGLGAAPSVSGVLSGGMAGNGVGSAAAASESPFVPIAVFPPGG